MAIRTTKKMVSFYKILSSQLSELPVKEGQLIYTEDNNRNYLDITDEDRIEIASYSLTQDSNDRYRLIFTYPDGTTGVIVVPGVRSVSTGVTNGTISVNTDGVSAEVAVAGLKSAAFKDTGVANGVAELDANGLVPAAQLPSFVDDVLEVSTFSDLPATGETGKIYVTLDTNLTYRWGGSTYVEISQSLALGETATTAYRGDRGAAAYAHSVTNKGSAFASNLYKITTNGEGHVTAAAPMTKALFETTYEIYPTLKVEIAGNSTSGYTSNYSPTEIQTAIGNGFMILGYNSVFGQLTYLNNDGSGNEVFQTIEKDSNTNIYITRFTIASDKRVTISRQAFVTLNTQQTFTAKKTYNVLPESSVVPTTANQLTNKTYVDTKQNQVLYGTSAPSNSLGVNGDIYIQTA